ncbi:MAG: hypothetical protein D6809_01960 [Gammaproteobacteria bacterium]|nr:MAG: hypothetical protein D6809_01960 [Gammaproteobacteria bacterium]
MSLALALHLLAAVLWVGGMFFAYAVLRPVAAAQLEPPRRLRLWGAVLERFLRWVWVAAPLLPLTGYHLLFGRFHGFAAAPLYVHFMQLLGWVMIGVFLHVWFGPFRRLRQAVAAEDWAAGGRALAGVRRAVAFNLLLGALVIAAAGGGRLLGS